MELQKLREASEKIVAFFTQQLDDQGRLKNEEVAKDMGAVYKLPQLLLLTGNGRLAHKVLNDIKARFMQENGDFISYPDKKGNDRKTVATELGQHWTYMNAWIAMAAHRLGRFDISYPAWEFIQQFYNPVVGGFASSGRYDITPTMADGMVMWSGGSKYDVGFFVSSFFGFMALLFGGNLWLHGSPAPFYLYTLPTCTTNKQATSQMSNQQTNKTLGHLDGNW